MNLVRGQAVVLGNTGKYIELLGRLVSSHGGDMTLLAGHLEAGDCAAAGRLAHALKGTAATLGADAVAAGAGRLERLLAPTTADEPAPAPSGDAVREDMQAVERDLQALSAALAG
jgi:HPt (histidine-containing phosphotransfer) domain-containing protein